MSQFSQNLQAKSKQIFLVYFFIFVPMWTLFLINHYILGDTLNHFGITPREISFFALLKINTSWLLHANYQHIVGNSTVLLPLLFIVCLFENKPYTHIGYLIFLSGLFTWLLGAPYSVHVGASGLIFSLFGYILSALVFGKNYLYILPVIFVGYFYSQSIFTGLIPKEEISFAAHFGGFIAGIVLGKIWNKKDNSFKVKYTLKQKIEDIKWKIKRKWKT